MALYKRNNVYWINISHNGKRIQCSARTSDKIAAKELHDKIKADLWRQSKLGDKPKRTWMEAAVRWINEASHKRSIRDDKSHLRWLDPHLRNINLNQVDRHLIDKIAKIKERNGVSNATINRMLALIKSILHKATNEWEWLDRAPKIKLRPEPKHRIRWLTQAEVTRLIAELPEHLADMAVFTLATGLRQSNVKNLQWSAIDLVNKHAWIHPDQSKSNKAIAIPLNEDAIAILYERKGCHPNYVFTYKNRPINQVNTKAWRRALLRAEIKNFRWHDLRHTWASWHVQHGTSLHELQQLGGWSNYNMVLRYAHLSSQHLKNAASRICVTNLLHAKEFENNKLAESLPTD